MEAPTIFEPSLEHHLVRIISLQLGFKPPLLGVQSLGWNAARTRFLSPTRAVTADGVQPTAKIIHPESKLVSSYFSVEDHPTSADWRKTTPQARYVMALLAASLTRGFLN